MRRLFTHTLSLAALLATACAPAQTAPDLAPLALPPVPAQSPQPPSAPVSQEPGTLRAAADRHGLDIGFFAEYWKLNPDNGVYDPDYVADLDTIGGDEFDILTLGTYQVSTNWNEGVWDFTEPDFVARLAERRNMKLHGHPLVYGQDNVIPPYLRDARDRGDWAKIRQSMRDNIERATAQYLGQVAIWDVVNEGVEWDGTKWDYRPSPFQRAFAQNGAPAYSYLDEAFHLARAGAPDATLVYNDFSNLEINGKSDFIYTMLQGMIARGVPVDAIGFQAHLGTDGRDTAWEDGAFDEASVRANFQRFADLGLDILITELDMYTRGTTQAELALQADMFARLTRLCTEQPACTTLQVWGFHDEYTWLDEFHGTGKTYPLLFDEQSRPKPSYYAVRDVLEGGFRR